MTSPNPVFPPLLNGKPVSAPQRPFSQACLDALGGEAEAGDIYWAKNNRVFDCAIVLEPEAGLSQALQMPYVAMVAFADAFGALAEPEIGLYFHWPDAVLVNGARVGQLRLAAPSGADKVPNCNWLILCLTIDIRGAEDNLEPGDNPGKTSLFEEGCGELTCEMLLESYSRHFLTWVHIWEEDGFRPVHDAWIGRAVGYEAPAEFIHDGQTFMAKIAGIDDAGSLMLKPEQADMIVLDLKHSVHWQAASD